MSPFLQSAEDKTFGLKNKNKSKTVQQCALCDHQPWPPPDSCTRCQCYVDCDVSTRSAAELSLHWRIPEAWEGNTSGRMNTGDSGMIAPGCGAQQAVLGAWLNNMCQAIHQRLCRKERPPSVFVVQSGADLRPRSAFSHVPGTSICHSFLWLRADMWLRSSRGRPLRSSKPQAGPPWTLPGGARRRRLRRRRRATWPLSSPPSSSSRSPPRVRLTPARSGPCAALEPSLRAQRQRHPGVSRAVCAPSDTAEAAGAVAHGGESNSGMRPSSSCSRCRALP